MKNENEIKLENLKDFVTIKEASQVMGVDRMTLRRWDNSGKLKAYRHPLTKWRLYKKEDLELILKEIKR